MYIANKINERLVVIGEQVRPGFVNSMQLVIGDERAALVDTGEGFANDLGGYVKQFTSLPVVVLLTHGHHDHAGGAGAFGDVYMSEADAAVLRRPLAYKPLRDGDVFDVGGVTIEAAALPGHTPGSFCFLNKAEGYACAGDAVNQCTWLWWDDCPPPSVYAEELRRFEGRLAASGIADIYHGHAMDKLPKDICRQMIAACGEIAGGETDGDAQYEFSFHVDKNDSVFRHVHGDVLIVYDKNNAR